MRTVNLTAAKAHLSELVRCAESGEEIVITRHGRSVEIGGCHSPQTAIAIEKVG